MKKDQKVVVLFGLTGCGKSTTAGFLKNHFCWIISSTHEIKDRLGLKNTLCENERNLAYSTLYNDCKKLISKGKSIIVDAGFNSIRRRQPLLKLCSQYEIKANLVECVCPDFLTVSYRINSRKLNRADPENQACNISTYHHIKNGFEEISINEMREHNYLKYDTYSNSVENKTSDDVVSRAIYIKIKMGELRRAS